MLAVVAAEHEIRGMAMPAAILAQVLGAQVGPGRIGQPAGEPRAFDPVGLLPGQTGCPCGPFCPRPCRSGRFGNKLAQGSGMAGVPSATRRYR